MCLTLALMIVREVCCSEGIAVGPIVVLSYKNHALDEFLLDLLKHRNLGISGQNGNRTYKSNKNKWLIRSGKAESEELSGYLEQSTGEERDADNILKKEIKILRALKKLQKEWSQVAASIEIKVLLCMNM